MNQDASRTAASMTKNRHLIRWAEKMAELTPAAIRWVDGSPQEYDWLCEQMAAWRKEVISLEEFFIQLYDHLPPEMIYERELLICRL